MGKTPLVQYGLPATVTQVFRSGAVSSGSRLGATAKAPLDASASILEVPVKPYPD